ncbi:hypothetical protein SBA3_670014 [Candidatus Sulfopaludibacter sp. SbA3]|nr:hypothetical protein SBA3_670014 [Candidatus Sulfopaludibacter sp. SbA3]
MSSKNKEKAEATRDDLGSGGSKDVGTSVQKCDKTKHWIRIVVTDADGKPGRDVKPTLQADGSTISVTLDKKGKYDTKKVLDSAADAKITFPDLFNCDWWPDGGTEPAPQGEKDLPPVADGDCAVRMAAAAGYRSYHDIWDAAENTAIKKDRPVANSLLKDDAFKGPEKKDKSVTKAVDKEWKFIVRALKKPKLRVVIVDKDLKPWEGVAWAITGIDTKKGKTGATGLFEVAEIDPSATAGALMLTPPPPEKQKKKKAKAAKLPDPPPYPLPINPDDFEEDAPTVTPLATKIDFDLKIGSLPAHKDKTGTLARMHNLAYLEGVTASDDDVKRCVVAYQKEILKQKNLSGAVADIKEDIETRYTKP